MVFPPSPPQGSPTSIDANLKQHGVALRCRAHWDLVDRLQEVFAAFDQVGTFRDGSNVGFGFNVYWLQQESPGVYAVTGPDYRTDGTRTRTDDLTEALWIHQCQMELAELTRTTLTPSRLDHMIDVTPAALAALSTPDRPVAMRRGVPPDAYDGAYTGWTVDLADAPYPAEHVVRIAASELARTAPAMCAALALPPHHLVIVDGDRFRGVWQVDPDDPTATESAEAVATREAVVDWPAPQSRLETVTHEAHGKTFFTSVDPEYRAEALEFLRVVDQRRSEELVDNFGLSFGFNWLIFRQEGDRMRMKCSDFTVPGVEATTADVTQAAKLRHKQLKLYRQLGRPKWTDIRGCMTTMRVHPGALERTQITMRRNGPTDSKDAGWVFGAGPGEPEILPAHEVHWRAPQVAVAFPLPIGFEVTITGEHIDKVVDAEGAVRWARTADDPRLPADPRPAGGPPRACPDPPGTRSPDTHPAQTFRQPRRRLRPDHTFVASTSAVRSPATHVRDA